MRRMGLVVEGLGDRKSFPSLVAKTGEAFGQQVFVRQVVEAGGWNCLRADGGLEKFCRLAAADGNVDAILVVIDLDDGCAKAEFELSAPRLVAVEQMIGIPISLCFCVREFEAWFLHCLDEIRVASDEISWQEIEELGDPDQIRGAKEVFGKHFGSRYRPSIDQEKFAKRIDIPALANRSRSFRKFIRCVTGVTYSQITENFVG